MNGTLLTLDEIKNIYTCYYMSDMSQEQVGKSFYISSRTVWKIVCGKHPYGNMAERCHQCATLPGNCLTNDCYFLCLSCMIKYGDLYARHGRFATTPSWSVFELVDVQQDQVTGYIVSWSHDMTVTTTMPDFILKQVELGKTNFHVLANIGSPEPPIISCWRY